MRKEKFTAEQQIAIKELMQIPGVGICTAQDFLKLGINRIEDLVTCDPQKLYDDFCTLMGTKIDRCQLYVFRCAIFFAQHRDCNASELKWWNFKD